MRRSHILTAAAALSAAAMFAGSAEARPAYRVIQWDITRVCQIYDFGMGGKPIPSNYRVLTRPLPTFGAALQAKNALWRRGLCSL